MNPLGVIIKESDECRPKRREMRRWLEERKRGRKEEFELCG